MYTFFSMIKKSILIEEKHKNWLEENSINLCKWVRNQIEKAIREGLK